LSADKHGGGPTELGPVASVETFAWPTYFFVVKTTCAIAPGIIAAPTTTVKYRGMMSTRSCRPVDVPRFEFKFVGSKSREVLQVHMEFAQPDLSFGIVHLG